MSKIKPSYSRVAQLKTYADFVAYQNKQGVSLPSVETINPSVFAQKINLKDGKTIGNSLCILPMEGWDGTLDGRPTELTKKRWVKFAQSGAKLLFGCEAVAIEHAAKANPNQLVMNEENFQEFVDLRNLILKEHTAMYGTTEDLVIGLQITHSGRFCKPVSTSKFESKTAYEHPILDQKFHTDASNVLTDDDIDEIIAKYIKAAKMVQKAGFDFVDIKHCHGYLGHEMLSAKPREGKYGGSFENRTRYLREIVAGVKAECPGLKMGIRFSAADFLPFKKSENETGEPETISGNYELAFGGDASGLQTDLTETFQFLELAESLGVELICVTLASPYYNPHFTRPALFPPSDGYSPPEDPLRGVQRHIEVTAEIKKHFPNLVIIGSGYSYLQEWLPSVANAVLANQMADMVGFGRMVLSYPTMPADMLQGETLKRGLICRTFSDCTTAPRNGMISGCFPLDPVYKVLPEAQKLKELK